MGAAALRRALAPLALLAAGCASDEQVRALLTDVNHEFRMQYEQILAENGTRVYKVKRQDAFNALRNSLMRLKMRIETQEPAIGYLNMSAPAPTPLDREEWQKAAEADLPTLRNIGMKHLGPLAWLIKFEPEGLDIVINATVIEVPRGTEVQLTMRMREVAPARSGMPRREYAPPTAVRMGLEKIWRELDRELKGAQL
jgi:hypothetical protein